MQRIPAASLILAPCGVSAASFTPLGDLAGGTYFSVARDISGDRAVIVGNSDTDRGSRAFIWTAGTGMVAKALPGSASLDSYRLPRGATWSAPVPWCGTSFLVPCGR